jgi:predicted ATPase/class 3 adenylate cyclase
MTEAAGETLTFLYTDIEGSTRLWQQHREAMPGVIARHDTLLRNIVESHRGSVFRTLGDAICAWFHTAGDALRAAIEAQHALRSERWEDGVDLRVRMGIHTGAAERHGEEFGGHTLNRVARLMSAASGGQTVLSDVTHGLLLDEIPEGVTLRDLGEHRLKDLERPERIYQVEAHGLPTDFPPLHTLDSVPSNLPLQTTSFIGRAREVETVATMLSEPDVRLLTLVGPGGTGKTRLALQAGAHVLDRFRDGVFLVPLAPIREPGVVAPTVASALGIREAEDRTIEARLADYLRDKDMLLIADNFEQVLPAAPLLADLLAAAPGLTVMVTSRSVLHLSAEHEYTVPPLAIPDPAHLPDLKRLSQYDAVALFIQRARAIKPDFAITNENAPAVAEICHRLDGLPLAIELAVARIRLFPPEALLKRLTRRLDVLTGGSRDLPARQQTLRGTIDWSYSLLAPEEQRLFTRLAVFAGSWSFEAAEDICNAGGDLDVLGGMTALVEQSLVRQQQADEPRFVMLETIREYASELLDTSGEVDVLGRLHAQWYLDQVQTPKGFLMDPVAVARWLPFLYREQDNLRAALWRSLEARDFDRYVALATRMCGFWFVQGHWSEALSWTEEIVPTLPEEPTEVRAIILYGAGFFLHRLQRSEPAMRRIEEAANIFRALDHRQGLSQTLFVMAQLLAERGEGESAGLILEEALAAGGRDGVLAPILLTYLGVLARERGDVAAARAHMEEGLAASRKFQHEAHRAVPLMALADLSRLEGDYERAAALYHESEQLTGAASVPFHRPPLLHNLAYISHHRGDDALASRQFTEALGLYREMGDVRGVAECVAGLGVLSAEPDPARAARLLAAAMAAAEALGSQLSWSNKGEYDAALAVIHVRLDTATFEAAWQEGRAMSLEDAVGCALAGAGP